MQPSPQTSEQPHCKACDASLSRAKSLGNKNGYELLPCPACGTVTVDPFPTVAELIKFYQAYEGTTDYRAKQDSKIARASKRIRSRMNAAPGKRFLDVGCNYGFTVKAALDLGLDAHGIDIDAVAVTAAQETFGAQHYSSLSVQNYAASGKKADFVYTAEVIEHVPDPDSFVAAISTILAKDGILFLTTPEGGHWSLPRDFTKWSACMPPEHITYFTRKGIKTLLEKHGIMVEKFYFSWKPGMKLIARKA
ncbi:MAG: class I SAM-dependent methyltransferase [Alphaproteobacteria bacterium]